ncbi:GPI-anchored adhesin-like protein [Hirschfeldia incana]|nr:GPI-anchored adhesin-like protein [Hirschfeldia incana]
MNRETSSSNAQTKKFPQPQPPEKKEKKLKRERLPANPSRGLSTRSSGSSSCSNGSGSGSISHRFLLSHSFSTSSSTSSSLGVNAQSGSVRPMKLVVAKTPKSAPVVSKPLIRKKPKSSLEETKLKPNATEKPHRCRTNPSFGKRVIKGSVLKKQSSVSREVKLKDKVRVDDKVVTPVSKLGTGSDLVYRSNRDDGGRLSNSNSSNKEKTPPVQASVSPEMHHCGTSMSLTASAQSQACYAAGHLLSGVSDKRKCKPKGILTVGKGKILNDSDEFDEGSFGSYDDNISVMPLPADASVHWLLSPCDEEKEDEKEIYENGFSEFQETVECVGHETPSPLSDRSTSSDLCNVSRGRSLSPMSTCRETMRRISSSLSPNELSRFRTFMQLSSPKCEHLGGDKRSPLSIDTLGSDNVIQTPESNTSLDSYFRLSSSQADIKLEVGSELESLTRTLQSAKLSPQEPSSSSFNFDSLATCSDSIDLSRFQRGLVEGDDAPAGKGRELLPCSAAESISTDGGGGGLICSEDSNWMACYNKS